MAEPVPASSVRPGDEVVVGKLGPHVVSRVERYDDVIVIVYFKRGEACYENRARDKSGYGTRDRLVERSLRPHQPDELVVVIRGDDLAAARLRKRLQREQAERLARFA